MREGGAELAKNVPPNIWGVLGIERREDSVTNLLAYCINNSQEFARRFADEALQMPALNSATAMTRRRIPGAGIPDLILVGTSCAAVVENKLKSGEGFRQRLRYSSPTAQSGLRSLFQLQSDAKLAYFYLTLFPPEDHAAEIEHAFKRIDYDGLLGVLADTYTELDATVQRLLGDLVENLRCFYERGRVEPHDRVAQVLERDGDPLGGSFLAFRKIMAGVTPPNGVRYRGSWKANRSGNPTFACQFYRDAWQPNEGAADLKDLEPRRHFSVHVEPTYVVLKKRMKVKLHFETYPYATRRVLRKKVPAERLAEFVALSKRFRNEVIESNLKLAPGFSKDRGSLQACRFDVSIAETRVIDLQAELEQLLDAIAPVVDAALRTLGLGPSN